jgi:hypothetical protein
VRDLVTEPYLTREPASGTRAVATAALARAGIELTPALQAASAQSLKRALGGGGFTLISRLTIEAEERAGVLVGLPLRGVDLQRELRAIRRRRPAPSTAARALLKSSGTTPRSSAAWRPAHLRNISISGGSMFTQRAPRRRSPIRRPSAVATGLITALAIAAPITHASAATPAAVPPPAGTSLVIGPTLSGDVFNGPLTIVTSPSPASATVTARTN